VGVWSTTLGGGRRGEGDGTGARRGGREVGENRGAGLVGWYGLADVGRFK
jgi:hypothetical protein